MVVHISDYEEDKERLAKSRKLYISDMHFFHEKINLQMDERGFSSCEEMNQYMIDQWNRKVVQKDEVYILGDLSFAKGRETNDLLNKLNGKLYLIVGNHDNFLRDKEFDMERFVWIKPYAEISDNGRKVVLSHYPVFCYNGQYRISKAGNPKAYMLYGHVHNTYDEILVNRFIKETRESMRMIRRGEEIKKEQIPCNMINCFCMYSDYMPLTLDEWILVDNERRKKIENNMINMENDN